MKIRPLHKICAGQYKSYNGEIEIYYDSFVKGWFAFENKNIYHIFYESYPTMNSLIKALESYYG
jgi:hypothetical protein